MSVKIGHGHRYTGEAFDVFEFTASLRPTFTAVATRLDARALIAGASEIVETRLRARAEAAPATEPQTAQEETEDRRDSPLWVAYRAYQDDQKNQHPDLRSRRPHDASLSIGRDEATGHVLMLLNAAADEYFDALRARDDVEAYSYTTSTDTLPAGVTRAEYTARGREWERLFANGPILASTVKVEFRSPHDGTMRRMASKSRTGLDKELLRAEAPTTATRANRRVTDLLFGLWFKQRPPAPAGQWGNGWTGALHDIAVADRTDLIALAAETVVPPEAILDHVLDDAPLPAPADETRLRAATVEWLARNPIGDNQ